MAEFVKVSYDFFLHEKIYDTHLKLRVVIIQVERHWSEKASRVEVKLANDIKRKKETSKTNR